MAKSDDVFVLDVRTKTETDAGIIPGATLIPVDELEERGGRVRDRELAESFGVDVVRTVARSGEGLERVRTFLEQAATRGVRPSEGPRVVSNVSPVSAVSEVRN